MAGRSPGQRFRSKTADFSDRLRASTQSSRPTLDSTPPSVPDLPDADAHKNKRRLPFLGRKKKPALPVAAPSAPSPKSSLSNDGPSVRAGHRPHSRRAKGTGIPAAVWNESESSEDESVRAYIPSHLPPVNVSPPSFDSVTEQFTPLKSNTFPSSIPNRSSRSNLLSQHSSSFTSPRSSESSKDGTRSPTPRPPRPTIAISPPRGDPLARVDDEHVYMSPRAAPEPPTSSSAETNFDTRPDPERLDVPSDGHLSNGSFSSLTSNSDPDRSVGSTSSLDLKSEAESEISLTRQRTNSGGAASSLLSISESSIALAKRRSGERQIPSPLRSKAPTAPPNIPLPTPPLSASSDGAIPNLYSSSIPSIPSIISQQHLPYTLDGSPRPRAITTCSLPDRRPKSPISPKILAFPTSPSGSATPQRSKFTSRRNLGDENSKDAEEASKEQLRRALTSQRSKIDDLSEYLLEIVGKHEAEKALLERRIEFLEKETRKRDREIRGLRYLVMNGGTSADLATLRASQRSSVDYQRSVTRSPGVDTIEGLQLLQQSSPGSPTSFARDSDRVGASTPSSSRSNLKSSSVFQSPPSSPTPRSTSPDSSTRSRTLSIAETLDNSTIPVTGLGLDMSQVSARASSSNTSLSALSSASASTSSLPCLTAANTASSGLSAIPESPTPYADPASPDLESALADRKREKDERRASRALKRLSASSTSSSVSSATVAASGAYASNLRKGKARSFGQVMEQSPELGELFERLKSLSD